MTEEIRYDRQVGCRLSRKVFEDLQDIAVYEGVKPGELLRSWVLEKIRAYRSNRDYQRHLRAELEEEED